MFSRNFCQKSVRVNLCNFHTVSMSYHIMYRLFFREIELQYKNVTTTKRFDDSLVDFMIFFLLQAIFFFRNFFSNSPKCDTNYSYENWFDEKNELYFLTFIQVTLTKKVVHSSMLQFHEIFNCCLLLLQIDFTEKNQKSKWLIQRVEIV